MSLAEAMKVELPPAPGAVAFLSATRQPETCAALRARRYLVADAGSAALTCGRVRQVIDDAVEGALALRGAHPPTVELGASAESTVRDQIFRAHLLGVAGIALIVPPLLPAAEGEEHLAFDDSAVVAAWMSAAERERVSLFFDESDRELRLLLPVRLGDRVPAPPPRLCAVEPLAEVAKEAPSAAPSDVPPSGEVRRAALVEESLELKRSPEPALATPIAPAPELPAPELPAPTVEPVAAIAELPKQLAPLAAIAEAAPLALAEPLEIPVVLLPAAPPLPTETAPPTERPLVPAPPPPVMAMPRRGVLKKRSLRDAPALDASVLDASMLDAPALDAPALDAPTPSAPISLEHQRSPEPAQTPALDAPTPSAPISLEHQRSPEPAQTPAAPIDETPAALIEPVTVAPRAPLDLDVPAQRYQGLRSTRLEGRRPLSFARKTEPLPAADEAREPARAAERVPEPLATPEPEPSVESPEEAAQRVVSAAEWRNHALELDKAKGPKPVAAIEKLFTSRYLPLLGAAGRGEIDSSVRAVIDTWRSSFEHSYREAYSALRVTGKRPPMVFDAPEIAGRIARLNGARATKLFLVDALRFDVGERVAQLLAERLTGRAVCVERMVLWAAIPATTPTQMGLLARGAEGLRENGPISEPDVEITRGRAVGTVRRERVGAREVMKLDLVEARVRSAGAGYAERLDAIAEEVAQITVRFIETLPPRTLLFLFGDHGFRLAASADGRATGPATQGGVSPEEVLVPGQAWLIGGVH